MNVQRRIFVPIFLSLALALPGGSGGDPSSSPNRRPHLRFVKSLRETANKELALRDKQKETKKIERKLFHATTTSSECADVASYTTITSASDCALASDDLGLTYNGATSSGAWPQGCFYTDCDGDCTDANGKVYDTGVYFYEGVDDGNGCAEGSSEYCVCDSAAPRSVSGPSDARVALRADPGRLSRTLGRNLAIPIGRG